MDFIKRGLVYIFSDEISISDVLIFGGVVYFNTNYNFLVALLFGLAAIFVQVVFEVALQHRLLLRSTKKLVKSAEAAGYEVKQTLEK